MLFLYFSGTGNSKFCAEYFASGCNGEKVLCTIENPEADELIRKNKDIVLAYPVYYSNLPKILRDYMNNVGELWRDKNVFLIATMGLFSGDGTGLAARVLKKYGACVVGGIHLTMPDCILDVKALKKKPEENLELVRKAREKMDKVTLMYEQGKYPKEGLHWWNRMIGLFGQRLYFRGKTKHYTDKLAIDIEKCVGCGKCQEICPMNNIKIENQKAKASDKCTMCYRCISNCPQKAITLIGKEVVSEPFFEYK